MTAPFRRFALLFAGSLVLSACSTGQQHLSSPMPGPAEGLTTIAQASQEATAGRYGVADKLLTDYSARYPSTSESADATFYRALFKLDPANPNASAREAAQLLDRYISTNTGTHKTEAQSLRRVASELEARAVAVANLSAVPKTEVLKSEDKSKDEELQRVRDELAKANAELERIKRRLAQPKP
ncbi:MAG: hypothetical protein JWL61_2443 [Gemmatimonadetes bacterium]|jgi:hypothetical protein|nr:hypothetical protein [Gemmatimonadota bacterium]